MASPLSTPLMSVYTVFYIIFLALTITSLLDQYNFKSHLVPLRSNLFEITPMYDDERKFSGGSQPLHDIKMQLGCYGAITDEENDLLKASATAASATNYKLPVVSHLLQRRARLQTATQNPTIDRSVCTCFDEFMGDYIAQKYPDKVKTNALNSILATWEPQMVTTDATNVKGGIWPSRNLNTDGVVLTDDQKIMRLFAEVEAKAYSQPHLISHLSDTDQDKIKPLDANGHQPAAVEQNTAFFASGNTVSVTLVAQGQAKTPFNQAVDLFNTLNPSHLSMAQITATEADHVKSVGAHVEKFCKRTARPVLTMKVAEKPWEHARDIHLSLIVIVVATVAFLIRDWQATEVLAKSSEDSYSWWFLFGLTAGNIWFVICTILFSYAIVKVDKVDWPEVSGASGANFEGTVVNVQYWIIWVVLGLLVLVHVAWLVRSRFLKDAYKQLEGSKMFTVWTNTSRFVITALIDVSVILAVAQLSISVLAHQGIMDYTELRSSWIIFFGLGVLSHFAHILHDFIQVYFRNASQETLINKTILWLIMGIRFTIMATILYWYFQFVGSSQTTSLANNQTDYNGSNLALGFVLSMLLIQLVESAYGIMDLMNSSYDMSGSTKYFRAIPYVFLSTVLMLTLVLA